jgi:hypothetical protein
VAGGVWWNEPTVLEFKRCLDDFVEDSRMMFEIRDVVEGGDEVDVDGFYVVGRDGRVPEIGRLIVFITSIYR